CTDHVVGPSRVRRLGHPRRDAPSRSARDPTKRRAGTARSLRPLHLEVPPPRRAAFASTSPPRDYSGWRSFRVESLQNLELDSAVLSSAFFGVVVGDGFVRARAARLDSTRIDTLTDHVRLDGSSTVVAELLILVGPAHRVRVTADQQLERLVLRQHLDRFVENREGLRLDGGLAGCEVDALNHTRELLDLVGHVVRTAVGVFESVLGLGLVGTSVRVTDETVLVWIGIG